MIIALEGPDCCGKTTLFESLKGRVNAIFVPKIPRSTEAEDWAHYNTMRAMYDPERLYIFDRSIFVSGQIYRQLAGKEPFDFPWVPKIRALMLDEDIETLQSRAVASGHPPVDPRQFSTYRRFVISENPWPVVRAVTYIQGWIYER